MDEPTLAGVIREYGVPLRRYVAKLTSNDRHLAEEVVQETLVRAWQRPAIVDSRHSSVRPWLFTVARNLVNDHWRARRTRPAVLGEAELAGIPEARDRIDETVQAQVMQGALARLAPVHRQVLAHVYYSGLSLADTAALLGIPVGTVKSRIYYGLRSLRAILDQDA
ncbi:sigma-70 family RNA polymerase sigma factor [Actinocrispum sp. NPDC049592]|uniref:sigma-70 family RNA polymerase sigma factor n=1 Tax=Actinocrispum sp. NPDC049592 TaxID=3154835 RepID=UPI00342045D2